MQHTHISRMAAGGLTLLTALTLAGCGGGGSGFGSSSNSSSSSGGTTSNAAEVLYVADAGNSNIPVIALSANGTPSQLGTPAALPAGSTTPQDLILDPLQKFVIVANSGGAARLSVYAVQANGGLPATPTQTVALPSLSTQTHSALAALTTAQGEFVYVAGSTVNTISVFQLNTTTGALTSVANAVPATGPGATLFPVSLASFGLSQGLNSQTYLLVGDRSPNVTNYTVNPDGTLSNVVTQQAGQTGPVYVVAPSDVILGDTRFDKVYAYDNQAQDMYTYQVGTGGVLSAPTSFSGPSLISSLTIYPNANGGALYLTQQGGANIYEYTVDATTGVPPTTPTQTTPLANAQIQGAALDAAGRYLGVLDSAAATPRVVVYSLNGKALGNVVASYSLSAGTNPVAVATKILLQLF